VTRSAAPGSLAGDPADRGDQLGHRVLAGDRIIEDGGIQRPPCPAVDRPVSITNWRTTSKIRCGRLLAANRRRQ
jgi:hypothetical protein